MKPLYTLQGVVAHGNNRGKELGFPTINFKVEQFVADGVYISKILFQNKWYNSLTFIGAAKTFNATDYLAETYILDFNKDIYGENVTVVILKKIRNNLKFPSAQDLIEQMKKDETKARSYFLSNSHNTSV